VKTVTLVTALLTLTSAAVAESMPGRGMNSRCWKWIPEGAYHEWICAHDATIDATLDATARDAQARNNRSRAWQSDTTSTSTDSNGQVTGRTTTSTITYPPRYR
jgi:hypothetical protein